MAEQFYADKVPDVGYQDSTGLFKPPRPVPGNKAGLYAGEAKATEYSALGKVFQEAAHTGYLMTKEEMSAQARKEVDPIEQARIDSLTDTFKQMEGNTLAMPSAKGAAASMQPGLSSPLGYDEGDTHSDPIAEDIWGDKGSMPENLRQGLEDSTKVKIARTYGSVTDVYADMAIWEAQKRQRARNPAFRDEIDEAYARITGGIPANQLQQRLKQALVNMAGLQGGADKERELMVRKLRGDAISQGIPELATIAGMVENGADINAATQKAATLTSFKAQSAVAKASIEVQSASDKQAVRGIVESANLDAEQESIKRQGMPFYHLDLQGGDSRDIGIRQTIAALRSGNIKLDETQTMSLALKAKQMESDYESYLKKAAEGTFYKTSNGSLTLRQLDKEAAEDFVNSHMKLFKEYTAALADPNQLHIASVMQGSLERAHRDLDRHIYQGDLGSPMQIMSIMGHLSNTDAFRGNNAWQDQMATMNSQMTDKVKGFLNNLQMALQVSNTDEGKAEGMHANMGDVMSTIMKKFQDSNTKEIPPMDLSQFFAATNNLHELPVPVQKSYVQGMFDPRSESWLKYFKRDSVDPYTGKPLEGQFTIFSNLTFDKFTKDVAKLGPEYKKLQKDFTEREFPVLFRGTMQELNTVRLQPGVHWHFGDDNRINIPPIDHAELVAVAKGDPIALRQLTTRAEEQRAVLQHHADNLNMAIHGLTNVAEANKGDPREYILNMFTKMNIDVMHPQNLPVGTNYDLIKEIINGIVGAIKGPKTPGEGQREQEEKGTK